MVADSPKGPWKDPLGKPLLPEDLTPTHEYDMGIFEELQACSTIRQNTVEITAGEKSWPVLFKEPSMGDHDQIRTRYMKYTMKTKTDPKTKEQSQEMVFDSDKSNMTGYHRELVMLTAFNPDSKERIFKTTAAFDKIFGTVNNIPKHGESLFAQFLEGANSVLKATGFEEASGN